MSHEQQTRIIDILKLAGFSKNETKIMFYLLNNDGVLSRELEIGANLRQPEVSIATKLLLQKKLVRTISTKNPCKKGRPLNKYFVTKTHYELLEYITNKLNTYIKNITDAKAELEAIF